MTFELGNTPPSKGNGKAYAFLVALKGHQGDACVPWPFCRDKHGRGMLGHLGKHGWAHRLMCEIEHGPPPTPEHKATHNCGKGHEGCVNPKHLEWKTQKENMADCWLHGTQGRHDRGPLGKLKPDEVQKIRELEPTHTQGQLAAMFNVAEGTINDIWRGRTWSRPHKIRGWSTSEDEALRASAAVGASFEAMAAATGRTVSATTARFYRLGLSKPRYTS